MGVFSTYYSNIYHWEESADYDEDDIEVMGTFLDEIKDITYAIRRGEDTEIVLEACYDNENEDNGSLVYHMTMYFIHIGKS